jgi:hypothetical protein
VTRRGITVGAVRVFLSRTHGPLAALASERDGRVARRRSATAHFQASQRRDIERRSRRRRRSRLAVRAATETSSRDGSPRLAAGPFRARARRSETRGHQDGRRPGRAVPGRGGRQEARLRRPETRWSPGGRRAGRLRRPGTRWSPRGPAAPSRDAVVAKRPGCAVPGRGGRQEVRPRRPGTRPNVGGPVPPSARPCDVLGMTNCEALAAGRSHWRTCSVRPLELSRSCRRRGDPRMGTCARQSRAFRTTRAP